MQHKLNGKMYFGIFKDMDTVPLKGEVWPKFLRENAYKLFKLGEA